MFSSLNDFLAHLETAGDLVRIDQELSPAFEVAAAIKYGAKEWGKAVLCNHVTGHDVPVVGNLLGTRDRLASALQLSQDVTREYLARRDRPVAAALVPTGPVKEVVHHAPIDILKHMPVLTHHEGDAGPYITAGITVARDPETGLRGMGIHRIQVKGPDKISVVLNTPPLATFAAKAEAKGVPLEVAVVVGLDPATFFASVTWAPSGIDKFDIAGALAGHPIVLVQCESLDLQVPALAQFVLEARLIPGARETDGPFGETTGIYHTCQSHVARVVTVTHRRSPIYHALVPFAGEEEVLLGVSWEGEALRALRASLPQVTKIHLCDTAALAIVQIEKRSVDDPRRVMDELLAAQPMVKVILVVDSDVDPYDWGEVRWALATRFQPDEDVMVQPDGLGMVIDPSTKEDGRGSKILLDATKPLQRGERFSKLSVPRDVQAKVSGLLQSYRGRQARA